MAVLYLTVQMGERRGAYWPIAEEPIRIGRSDVCEICIVDPLISRRHCEVWLADDRVHVRDLGSSNATLVNGRPMREAVLKPGDTLALGATTFLVAERESMPCDSNDARDNTAVPVAIRSGIYNRDASAKGMLRADPRTIHELYDLFALGRALGEVSTLHELVSVVKNALDAHFQPEAFWFATCQAQGSELFFQPTDCNDGPAEAPLEAMRRAISEQQGILVPRVRLVEGERICETLLVLPLAHADETLGCMALRGRGPGRLYKEPDLEFALGIAAIAAPHLRAVRHAEQIRRDNELQRLGVVISGQLLGDSAAMCEVRALIQRAAGARINMLLLGETGTGKELAARLIHDLSPRAGGPYVALNCAAIPRELFESEMFGHEKGAFSGAGETRIGRIEETHGGTLLLDEVGDLAPENQAKLLRAIETGVFRRVGGTKDMAGDVRFIGATNRTLSPETFRTDLFHRLNGLTITMPPLREHTEDIPILARQFIQDASRFVPGGAKNVSPEALSCLRAYPWPGNVRELKAAIERAVLFCDGLELGPQHFLLSPCSLGCATEQSGSLTLAEVERRHIIAVLRANQGNMSASARILGINRVTLYKRIAMYDIQA